MLNPGDILDAIVAMYQSVPALVAAVGSTSRIYPFVDAYPGDGLAMAVYDRMKPGELMIVWNGVRMVKGSGITFRSHHFSAIWRPGAVVGPVTSSASAYTVLPLLQDGVPAGQSVGPLYFGVLPTCLPMTPHEPTRKSIVINDRGVTLDYIDSSFTIAEIGDP
jgi:hypothetical protein